jgi:branched-chain amino acid transport system permease protein
MSALRMHSNAWAVAAIVIAGGALVYGRPPAVDTAIVTGIYALIALSAGLIYGQAGILSMAQGVFAAIGAYTTAVMTTRFGWPPYGTFVMSMVIPALMAFCMSPIVNRLGPLAVALGTLAFAKLLELLIRSWSALTGGYIGITGIPPLPGIADPFAYALLVWALLMAAAWSYENLMNSMFGNALSTIRHDRARATADGVPVGALLSTTYALSACFAGAAGWLYAHHIGFIDPHSLDSNLSITVMLMAVVGGVGAVVGPVTGALLLTVLLQALPAQEVQGLYFGSALIAVLVLAPEGLLGTPLTKSLRAQMRGSREPRTGAKRPKATGGSA